MKAIAHSLRGVRHCAETLEVVRKGERRDETEELGGTGEEMNG